MPNFSTKNFKIIFLWVEIEIRTKIWFKLKFDPVFTVLNNGMLIIKVLDGVYTVLPFLLIFFKITYFRKQNF